MVKGKEVIVTVCHWAINNCTVFFIYLQTHYLQLRGTSIFFIILSTCLTSSNGIKTFTRYKEIQSTKYKIVFIPSLPNFHLWNHFWNHVLTWDYYCLYKANKAYGIELLMNRVLKYTLNLPMRFWLITFKIICIFSFSDALLYCLKTSSRAFPTWAGVFDVLYFWTAEETDWVIPCWERWKECSNIRITSILWEINDLYSSI